MRRETVFWHDGVLGMLALSLISLIPVIGLFMVLFSVIFAAGALLLVSFNSAFPGENTPEIV